MDFIGHFRRRLRGKFFSLFWIALLTVGLFAACNPGDPVPEGQSAAPKAAGGSLRLLYWQAPTVLNPHLSTGIKDIEASRLVLEPLAEYNANEELIPTLAAEIPSPENGGLSADGTSVTWTLKDDVLWSDGEPFTAEDVAFTYDFLSKPETGATSTEFYGDIAAVEAVDCEDYL